MATSSKVVFKLETLKEEALRALHAKLQPALDDLADYNDDAWETHVQAWREEQEARISHIFSRLGGGDLSNEELSKFQVRRLSRSDWDYSRRDAENKVRRLQAEEEKIRAKASSLVGDKEGNIYLTKTQLSEFFGL